MRADDRCAVIFITDIHHFKFKLHHVQYRIHHFSCKIASFEMQNSPIVPHEDGRGVLGITVARLPKLMILPTKLMISNANCPDFFINPMHTSTLVAAPASGAGGVTTCPLLIVPTNGEYGRCKHQPENDAANCGALVCIDLHVHRSRY